MCGNFSARSGLRKKVGRTNMVAIDYVETIVEWIGGKERKGTTKREKIKVRKLESRDNS